MTQTFYVAVYKRTVNDGSFSIRNLLVVLMKIRGLIKKKTTSRTARRSYENVTAFLKSFLNSSK